MRKRPLAITLAACVVTVTACKTVVTTTTEVRPSRYAAREFTRAIARDSLLKVARSAFDAENIEIQQVDRTAGMIEAGPVAFAATADQPALQATVKLSAQQRNGTTIVRIFATSILEPSQKGGQDARLVDLIQRIERRLDALTAR